MERDKKKVRKMAECRLCGKNGEGKNFGGS
jgi:ribosomal protein S14